MTVTEDAVKGRLYPEAAALLSGIGRELVARSDLEVRETLKGVLSIVQSTLSHSAETDAEVDDLAAVAFSKIEKLLAKLGYNTVV